MAGAGARLRCLRGVGRNDGRAAPVCSRAIVPQRDTVRILLSLTLSPSYSRAQKRALSAGCSLSRRTGAAVRPTFSFLLHAWSDGPATAALADLLHFAGSLEESAAVVP